LTGRTGERERFRLELGTVVEELEEEEEEEEAELVGEEGGEIS
jgi:hypothetical protein